MNNQYTPPARRPQSALVRSSATMDPYAGLRPRSAGKDPTDASVGFIGDTIGLRNTSAEAKQKQEIERLKNTVRNLRNNQKSLLDSTQVQNKINKSAITKLAEDNRLLREKLLQDSKPDPTLGYATRGVGVSSANHVLELEEEINRIRRRHDDLVSENSRLRKEVDKLQTEVDERSRLIATDGTVMDREKKFEKTANNLQVRLSNVAQAKQMADTRLKDMESELMGFKIAERKAYSEIDGLKKNLDKKKREVSHLKKRLVSYQEGKIAAEQEVGSMLLQFQREKEEWQKEVDKLRNEVLDAKRLNRKLMHSTESTGKADDADVSQKRRQSRAWNERERSTEGEEGHTAPGVSPSATANAVVSAFASQARSANASTRSTASRVRNALRDQQNLERLMVRLKEVTGDADVESIVKRFIAAEDVNTGLLSYVSEMLTEQRRLEDNVSRRDEEISELKDKVTRLEETVEDNQKLKGLEAQLRSAEAMRDKLQERCDTQSRLLVAVRAGIQSLVERFGVDVDGSVHPSEASEDEFGHRRVEVTDANLVEYLSAIEKHLTIVHMQSIDPNLSSYPSVMTTAMPNMSTFGQQPTRELGDAIIHTENVSKFLNQMYDDDDDDDEGGCAVLSREELKDKSLLKIKDKERQEREEHQRRARIHMRMVSRTPSSSKLLRGDSRKL